MKRLLFAALSCLEVALLLTSTGVEAAPSQDGSEWQIETVDSLGDVGWDTSIALDDCGNPHISYYDSTEGTLKYAHWTGSAWHIEAVDDVGQGGVGYIAWDTSIALDRLGYPHISYCYSVAPNADGTLKYARWDGSSWQMQTVDTARSVGWYTSLALDSLEYPHISHYEDHDYNLRYSRWDGSVWHSEAVESAGMVGAFSSLVLDEDDYGHISYWDDANRDLEYVRWDGVAWQFETVDGADRVGAHTSLVLDSLDHPHVSYVDYTHDNLEYARWNGSSWQIETVDDRGVLTCEPGGYPQVGCDTSLALSTEDHARMSYYDSANGDLEYAYWDGSGWQLETVDSIKDVGQGNSLALDAGGRPHISYYDVTNGDLKHAWKVCVPTAIELLSFTAEASPGSVILAWETGTEVDNAGFNLYRATAETGPYTKINDALISAHGDPASGASYSFVDTPGHGTFCYKLEDLDFYGVSTLHGPVNVQVERKLLKPRLEPRPEPLRR